MAPVTKALKQVEKKIATDVVKKVEKLEKREMNRSYQKNRPNSAAKRVDKIVLKREKDQLAERIFGQLPTLDYQGLVSKFGKGGIKYAHSKAELHDDMAKIYALCQVLPAVYKTKIPDGYDRKTARYDSKKVFNVTVDPNGGNPSFAFCVQPKIGNYGDPKHFQVAMLTKDALNNPVDADFTSVGAYQAVDPVDSADLRVDNNFTALTAQPPGSYFNVSSGTAQTYQKPWGTGQPAVINQSLNILYDGNGTNSDFILPVGEFYVQLFVQALALDVTSGSVWIISMPDGGTWNNQMNEVVTGAGAAVTRSTKGIWVSTVTGGTRLRIACNPNTIGAVGSAQMWVSPILKPDTAAPVDDGLIETIRPVAMSVLTTYNGPLLQNGGQIASALVPSKALDSNFFTNAPDNPGALRSWNTIASLNEAVHDGPLNKGAYTWWTQEDNADYEFDSVSALNDKDMPAIVVAGTWNPGTDVAGSATVVCRVEVEIVFEITTLKTLLPKDKYVGSDECVSGAKQMLQIMPLSLIHI